MKERNKKKEQEGNTDAVRCELDGCWCRMWGEGNVDGLINSKGS